MVGAHIAAGHVVGSDARVVLADVGERRDPGDVAERPDVLGRAHALVDLDPAAARSSARAARARRRSASGRSRGAAGRTAAGCRPQVTTVTRDAFGARSEPDLDAVLAQRLGDERGRVGVDAREEPLVALDERHLRADALEELRELAADRAATEHERAAPGTSSRLGRLDVRPVVDLRRARRSAGRPATSRSRSRAGRSEAPGRRPARTPGSVTIGVAAHELGVAGLEPLDLGAVVALGDDVAPREDLLRIERCRLRSPRACAAPRLTSSGARSIVFVGMHAQYEHSPPTRRRSTTVTCDVAVEPAEGADEMLAGRPSTENDDVRQGSTRDRSPSGTPSRSSPRLLVDV